MWIEFRCEMNVQMWNDFGQVCVSFKTYVTLHSRTMPQNFTWASKSLHMEYMHAADYTKSTQKELKKWQKHDFMHKNGKLIILWQTQKFQVSFNVGKAHEFCSN